MANKAYKFRLYPTQEQEQLLAKTFGCVRFVYNKMLEERIHIYNTFKADKEALKSRNFPLRPSTKRVCMAQGSRQFGVGQCPVKLKAGIHQLL